jgi:hypothetical protein
MGQGTRKKRDDKFRRELKKLGFSAPVKSEKAITTAETLALIAKSMTPIMRGTEPGIFVLVDDDVKNSMLAIQLAEMLGEAINLSADEPVGYIAVAKHRQRADVALLLAVWQKKEEGNDISALITSPARAQEAFSMLEQAYERRKAPSFLLPVNPLVQ